MSEGGGVKYGSPQGSILGPVLFILYLKGLPSALTNIKSKLCLYSDDLNLLVSSKTISDIEIAAQNNL